MIELIIFDVDGTLAKSYSLELMPSVKEFFQLVFQAGCAWHPKIAIATNQGGVGMRYWMEKDHFGKPAQYPSQAAIEERMQNLIAQLNLPPDLPVYVAYRYKNIFGKWSPVPPGQEQNPRWNPDWRKPGPGMLLQAMRDAVVGPDRAMYVGDRKDDQKAARAAGCCFSEARDFFQRDWSTCQDLESAAQHCAAVMQPAAKKRA
jgi:HAD superfamily hydrolase (TIGR01662 family)